MLFYKRLVERTVRRDGPARLMEVGCAFGRFLSIADASWLRLGCDISEYALHTALTRAPGAYFIAADAAYLPVKCTFDVIVAFDSLEHVHNLELVADGFKNMLSSRGYLIFVVPVYDGPMGPVIRLLDHDTTHIHKKPRDFWLGWAESHFELCEWQGIFRYLFPAGVYLHFVTKVLRKFAPAIVVVTRKKR
jgi:SAM-dependent methyltransferase